MRNQTWWVVVILLATMLFGPIIWLLVAKALGMTVAISGGTGGLLAAIGGIMGAIFAAGGLVIALVSVYTQLTLETRLEERANLVFEQRTPELLERAERRIEAFMLARSALEMLSEGDWQQAEELTEEALRSGDPLNTCSELGLGMTSRVVGSFVGQISLQPPFTGPFEGPPTVQTVRGRPFGRVLENDDLPNAAIKWLTRARDRHEGSQVEIWTALALMYGRTRRYQDMMDALRECDRLDTTQRAKFRQVPDLLLLVHACGNNVLRLRELGEKLDMQLPVSEERVCTSIQSVPLNPPIFYFARLQWYVMGQPEEWSADAGTTFPISIDFQVSESNGQRQVRAHYLRYDDTAGVNSMYPRLEHLGPPEYVSAGESMAVDELVSSLAKQFLFICKVSDVA